VFDLSLITINNAYKQRLSLLEDNDSMVKGWLVGDGVEKQFGIHLWAFQ
jgi:hypothetical protein